MGSIRLADLPEMNPEIDKLDGYIYVVNESADDYSRASLKMSIKDLLDYAGVIVECQYCHQPTMKNRACIYCGGQPRFKESE